MSTSPSKPSKPGPAAPSPSGALKKGVKIFTYPKIIFLWPTLIAAIICSLVMATTGNETKDPMKEARIAAAAAPAEPGATAPLPVTAETTRSVKHQRFLNPANMCGLIFLIIFFINLLIMAVDFPRFTIIAIILFAVALSFFLMWLNVYFDLLPPVRQIVEQTYTVANSGFYATVATIIFLIFTIVWVTRYLDYWEIHPNEILHHHGPLSDLERFPTMNMKFDKEIPDILEYLLLRSGRLVLHFEGEKRSASLDNVLWIDRIEDELKKVLSRMEVRITTDQEAASL